MHFTDSVALKALLFTTTFSASASAFWRMPCRARSGLARIDPLVSPGTMGEHAHAIHGGSGFSETSKTDDLLKSDCTSCEVSQDKSAYWHPALYFKSSDGKFKLVDQVGGMLAYYLLFPNKPGEEIVAFPKDFEMISGDTNQRNFSYPVPDVEKSLWNVAPYSDQKFLRQAALGFNCLNYAKAPEGSLYRHSMPDKGYLDANCKDGVRFELMFPSCWNGKDVTSEDKKSHVAFPSQVMTGDCPKEFPKRLPSLFYEIIWNTNEFAGKDGEFVIANGDPTGNGFHGDFIMGWETDFLQKAVNTCTNPSGKVEDCPLFTIQDQSKWSNCNIKMPEALAKEKSTDGMSSLPGNVPIVGGPAYAKGAAPAQEGTTVTGTQASTAAEATSSVVIPSYAPGSKVPSGSPIVPGGVFAAKATGSPSAASSAAPAGAAPAAASVESAKIAPLPTPAPAAGSAATSVQTYFSTEYSTRGNVVNEILWVQKVETVTASQTTTLAKHKRHMHRAHGRSLNF